MSHGTGIGHQFVFFFGGAFEGKIHSIHKNSVEFQKIDHKSKEDLPRNIGFTI